MIRKDSQGICFLGKIKFSDFIKHHLGELEGEIIDIDTNKVMGKHKGFYFYTIGQRSGLRLGGGPWYVISKDIEKNIVYISKENITNRARKEFTVGKFNWIAEEKPQDGNYLVKIRHGEHFYNCSLTFDGDTAKVMSEKEDKGIAPGQFAVFYKDDICLGGSVILE